MEDHIIFSDAYASPPARRRGSVGTVFRAIAAISVTAMLMLGTLPPADVAVVRQSLAIAATHPIGSAHVHAQLA